MMLLLFDFLLRNLKSLISLVAYKLYELMFFIIFIAKQDLSSLPMHLYTFPKVPYPIKS